MSRIGLIFPASINRAISINWVRFGSTMKNRARTPNSFAFAAEGLCGDADERAAAAEHAERTVEGIAANRVENHVEIRKLVLEADLVVVDHLVRTEFAEEIVIACGRGGDHFRRRPSSRFARKDSHASGRAMDQHALCPW